MMDIAEIKEYLPHRFPFLLIDRVIGLELGKEIRCIKNVSINEHFFEGHFPDKPVMPGVLILEAMAQAAGILGFKTSDKTPADGSIYMFAGVEKVRFKRQVVPGDQLILTARYLKDRRGMWYFECEAHVDGKLATSATITCADTVK